MIKRELQDMIDKVTLQRGQGVYLTFEHLTFEQGLLAGLTIAMGILEREESNA